MLLPTPRPWWICHWTQGEQKQWNKRNIVNMMGWTQLEFSQLLTTWCSSLAGSCCLAKRPGTEKHLQFQKKRLNVQICRAVWQHVCLQAALWWMFPSVRPMSAFCRIFSLKYDYSIVTEDYFSKDSLYKLICTVGMGGTGSPPREKPMRPIQKRDRGRKKRLSDWALHPSSI